jgi:hypothetical protein
MLHPPELSPGLPNAACAGFIRAASFPKRLEQAVLLAQAASIREAQSFQVLGPGDDADGEEFLHPCSRASYSNMLALGNMDGKLRGNDAQKTAAGTPNLETSTTVKSLVR